MKINHVVKSILFTLLLLNLTNCATLGSKESLVTEDGSSWKTQKTRSGVYYTYKCGSLSISVREIIYNKKYHSFGPIIPIIPSGVEQSFENKSLAIETEIVGYVKKKVYTKEDFVLSIFEGNKELTLTEQKLNFIREKEAVKADTLWGQYKNTYVFNKTLKELNSLVIKVKLPFQSCIVPKLKLIRTKASDNEFIIAPGV